MVGFAITYLVLDLITGDLQSSREYIRQIVIVGVLVGIGWYLGDLFKHKETDE